MRFSSVVLAALFVSFACGQLLVSIENELGHSIKYTISNEGASPARFLTYGTPFEGNVFYPLFNITTPNGVRVPYVGPVARRVSPAPEDAYLTLPAHSHLSISVDLLSLFSFEEKGLFSVEILLPEINPTLIGAMTSGGIKKHISEESKTQKILANQYENCTPTEKSQVDSAAVTATSQAKRSRDCMNAGSCNTLSTKWFGSTTTTNVAYYNYDKSAFTNIYSTLSSKGIHAYCNPSGCGSNVYAYVYPSDPSQTVYLCGAFWSQPSERANTIVHEMSHFKVIAGTEDYEYGKPACQTLAKNDPYKASHNADNVCYFSNEA